MKIPTLAGPAAACFCLGLAVPLLAAEPSATGATPAAPPGEHQVAAPKPAEKCLGDLRAFDSRMEKDGHWLGASGYGYGYPMGESGYGYAYPMGGDAAAPATGYLNARPGYEVRILSAAANVLARHGEQQACENVLATTQVIYKSYVANMHDGRMPTVDVPGWRQQQISAAQPVTSKDTFRSDELLGTDVRDAHDAALGSVDDLVMNPQTGKIAYLVIARGGIFGIDEKHVPVPWQDFKITPNAGLLVLDTTKAIMGAAPRVTRDRFSTPGQFGQESEKVDAYWRVHLAEK